MKLSDTGLNEINEMKNVCYKVLTLLKDNMKDYNDSREDMKALEQLMDDMTLEYRENMFARIKDGTCHDESGIVFSEVLTDFERIGDHALNISKEIFKIGKIEH